MDNTSVWVGTSPAGSFPAMAGDAEADAAVIGGGITGVTAALLLARAGLSVVVLEALRVGQGTTGYSTGNLYATLDDLLYRVRDTWDQETSNAVARSRGETVDWIERTVAEHGIDCGFRRCPHYLFPVEPGQLEDMRKELEAVQAAGLQASIVTDVPLPGWRGEALRIDEQAQFQPYAFVQGLAQRISSDRCRIFENTKALEIDGDKGFVATTGGTVRARSIFMATHMPKGFSPVQTVLGPYREYGVAAPFEGGFPPGIYWTLEEPGHSVRLHESGGARYLVAIGEKHKTGQPEPGLDYYAAVEDYARAQFGVTRFSHRWSAQHYRPADKLPYIGRAAGSDNVYLATGFGTNGLVYGALAARMVADAILQRENPWRDLYNATRFTPAKSLPDFARENANSAAQYARDYLTSADTVELADIEPGQGGLAKVGGDKLAVFRQKDGEYVAMSPVCPHLGCIVHWNTAERTWDCPCHGSRFRCDGEVLEGPAIKALERRELAAE